MPTSPRRIPKPPAKGKPPQALKEVATLLVTLQGLREKYLTLATLRRQGEMLAARGVLRLEGDAGRLRRMQARAVARQFPGALRELEGFDSAALWQRAWAVGAELTAAGPRQRLPHRRWLRWVMAYHAATSEGLCIKRWLRAAGATEANLPTLLPQFCAYYALLPGRTRARQLVDVAFLARYLPRPGGRMAPLIWHDLARRYQVSPALVQRVVVGR